MADSGVVTIGGTDLYYGPCKNSARSGLCYVSFGRKTTYIVNCRDATEKRVREVGANHGEWQKLSVLDPHNDLWNV